MRHGARKLKTNNLPDEFIPWLIKRKQSNSIIYRLTQEADGFNENNPMNEYWDPGKSYDDNKYIRVAIHLITCPYHLRLSQNKQTFHKKNSSGSCRIYACKGMSFQTFFV